MSEYLGACVRKLNFKEIKLPAAAKYSELFEEMGSYAGTMVGFPLAMTLGASYYSPGENLFYLLAYLENTSTTQYMMEWTHTMSVSIGQATGRMIGGGVDYLLSEV